MTSLAVPCRNWLGWLLIGLFVTAVCAGAAQAAQPAPPLQPPALPRISLDFGGGATEEPEQLTASLQILLLLTVLSLAPAIITMLTSFARTVIVLSFTRSALGIQQAPPNSVLIGLALLLTAYTMAPVWEQIDRTALKPYQSRSISYEVAMQRAGMPIREFILKQVRQSDLQLFVDMSRLPPPARPEDVPLYVLAPAFVISEMKTAFIMGFMIFIPFIIVDMVVASTLMSMGMMMMPPMLVSLPCKLLLFVMIDGWHLITKGLLASFS